MDPASNVIPEGVVGHIAANAVCQRWTSNPRWLLYPFGVNSKRAWVLVSALGLEQDCGGSRFTEVGERGVAKLVQRPTTGGLFEDGRSPFVGKLSPACLRAFVSPGRDDIRSPVSKEHGSPLSPG